MPGDVRSKREAALRRWEQLSAERSSWMPHWQELAHYMLPRSGRFNTSAVTTPNHGGKRHMHILDNTAQRSITIMAAGLLAGASSPARPWFKLRTPDDQLNERPAVKEWLQAVEKRMRQVFAQSNTYRAFRQLYQELGVFGTGADLVLPDFEDVIHHYPMTVGEYALDTDHRGQVDTFYRKIQMRVGQLVQKFGYTNCSRRTKELYDNKSLNIYVDVVHQIEPRRERNPLKMDNKNMPWASCYYEIGALEDEVLRESGFDRFPVLAPRWETRGADVYGSSPGMVALGDSKQLQQQQFRKSQAIDFMSLPPLQAPVGSKVDMTPGAVNYVDMVNPVRNLMEVRVDLNHLLEDIVDVRGRVQRAFYEDMFLMIMSDNRQQPATAREIAERHEEKLLMLGPVLESLHDEMLSPTIETTFAHMIRAGIVPPAPEELQGAPLSVEFVSMLAQAQRLVGLTSVDRLLGMVSGVAQLKPDVLDKVDTDQLIDVYSDMLGVDPTLIVADEQVALIREQRAQLQAQQEAMVAAPGLADAAKTAAEAQALNTPPV